jgi:uncharacterized protein CbrC (UPF0167 family)
MRQGLPAGPVCQRRRGWAYKTVHYGEYVAALQRGELLEVCPWCIADGSAAAQGISFADGTPRIKAGIPEEIVREVTERTPSSPEFHQSAWQACCNDACAYLGLLSAAQIAGFFETGQVNLPSFLEGVRDRDTVFHALHMVEDSRAFWGFRCLHCGQIKILYDD